MASALRSEKTLKRGISFLEDLFSRAGPFVPFTFGRCRLTHNPTPMYNKENLNKLKKMDSLAPEVMKAFRLFDKVAVADGAIPVKYKELIAVAVALTTQCPYCIDIHSGNARKAGATDEEIAEAAMVAAALRAGAAVTHATHAVSS